MTRVCIVGAGAIGGFLGTRLALAGDCQVCALAGATLAALQQHRLAPDQDGQRFTAPARVADRADALGPCRDLAVIVAVKAHALGLAPALVPLPGERTVVLPAMNGVPWWFCEGCAATCRRPAGQRGPGRSHAPSPSRDALAA